MINFIAQIMNGCPAIKEATPNNKRAFLVPVSYTHLTLPTTPYV